MGIAAGIAAVFGTTAEVVTTVATVVGYAGTALSVVGAVTGDSTLTKIGGVMGLAGGIVGISNMIDGASAAAGASSDVASAAPAADVAAPAADAAAPVADTAGTTTYPVGKGMLGSVDLPSLQVDSGAAAAPVSPAVPTPASAAPPVDPATGVAPTGTPAQNGMLNQPVSNDILDTSSAQGGTSYGTGFTSVKAPGIGQSITDWFNGLDSNTKGHVISGLVQGGGAMVGGLFNGWSAEQKLALEQQKQNLTAQAYNTSVANANAQPTVTPYKPKGMLTS